MALRPMASGASVPVPIRAQARFACAQDIQRESLLQAALRSTALVDDGCGQGQSPRVHRRESRNRLSDSDLSDLPLAARDRLRTATLSVRRQGEPWYWHDSDCP